MKKVCLLFIAGLLLLSPFASSAQEPNVPTVEFQVDGLQKPVTIRRDERGVPYIEAQNEPDLFFAQGYVTASDRLWQMDLLRRVARGESAEIFGQTTLDEDKRWRKFGFAAIAKKTLPKIAPEARAAFDNYARGVNAYLNNLKPEDLPVECKILQYRPREWQPEDSILIGKILADGLSTTWPSDLLRQSLQNLPADKRKFLLNPSTPDDVLLIGKDDAKSSKFQVPSSKFQNKQLGIWNLELGTVLTREAEIRRRSLERVGFYAKDLAASNNWVIAGKRTANGKPILANDPHLQASAPPVWYLINLSAPNFHAAGVTFPGSPGVMLGHNETVAWGATNVGPDVQDLYLENFDKANPGWYQTPNGWQQATVRREEIKVRDILVLPETRSEFVEVVTTRNGPICVEEKGKRYSLKWTAFDPNNNELEAFYYLDKARNWDEFQAALKRYGGSMQNFVYADTTGNIGWYAAGRVPLRKTGDGSLPYDGKTDDGAWTGFVPFGELPHLYNPPNGLIVTANQRTVGLDYKYQNVIARDFDSPYRARRIFELLDKNPKITVEDVAKVQYDVYNIADARFAKFVVQQKAASNNTIKLLANWDGRMNADSKAALLAEEMRGAFRNRVLTANLGAERSNNFSLGLLGVVLDKLIQQQPKTWLPREFATYTDLLKACETDARANLTAQLGADESKWSWGAANKIYLAHPLANEPFIGAQFAIEPLAQNGSVGVPNVGSNVSMRLIATPNNWDLTRQVIPSGESGDPESPHYSDQVQAWYTGNTPVFPFTSRAVQSSTRAKTVLMPPYYY